MGLFSRRGRDEDETPRTPAEPSPWELPEEAEDDVVDTGRPERPVVRPASDADRARVRAALEDLAREAVDVDDLAALGAAYDRAVAAGLPSEEITERYGLGIGEHLVRHGRMDWQVVSDVFGTDLGVVARRRELSVVPTNIVATRYLRGETGWVPGVVGHLVRLGNG